MHRGLYKLCTLGLRSLYWRRNRLLGGGLAAKLPKHALEEEEQPAAQSGQDDHQDQNHATNGNPELERSCTANVHNRLVISSLVYAERCTG